MEESERDGTDPDERLREVVERAVSNGMSFGGQIGAAVRDSVITAMDEEKKRTRVDGT